VKGSKQEGSACNQAEERDHIRSAAHLEAWCEGRRLITINISHVFLRAQSPCLSSSETTRKLMQSNDVDS
jgi:hypothetical protein